MDVSVFSLLG